jgi:multiple sugar transport system permease protein
MDISSAAVQSSRSGAQVALRRKTASKDRAATWARTIAVALITGIFFFPIFFWFLASFKPFGLIFQLPPVFIFKPTFIWYQVVLGGLNFNELMIKLTGATAGTGGGFYYSLPYIVTSVVVALVSTALVILVATPAAYSLSRFTIRRRQDLTFWILSTRMMPPIVAALPLFFMYRQAD